MILSTENKITAVTQLDTPDFITGYGKDNMLDKDLSLQFRYVPLASNEIIFTPPSSLTFYCIALIGTNIRSSATVTADYGSGAVPLIWFAGKQVLYIPDGVTTASDVTITIADPGNPDGYIKIGYILFGNRVLFSDPTAGSIPEPEDTSLIFESQTIQVVGEEGQFVRSQDINCTLVTRDDYDTALETWQTMKNFRQFLFFFTEEALDLNEPLWVRFTEFAPEDKAPGRIRSGIGAIEYGFNFSIKEAF